MILFPHRSSVHSTADFLGFNVLLPGNLYLKSEVLLGFFFTHRILKLRKKKNHSKTFPIWNRPACMLSHVNHVWLFAVPWTVAHQALLSMEFSRQEYWSGLPCPSPEDLPHPGTEPRSPALQADSLPSESLEWVAMPSSRGSSYPTDQAHVSYEFCIDRQVLYH